MPIKINLNSEIKDLNEKPIDVMGKLLAIHLANSTDGDALKLYGWAQSFHKGEEISIDKSDFKTLREFVENVKTLTILSKSQILETLDKCEKAESK